MAKPGFAAIAAGRRVQKNTIPVRERPIGVFTQPGSFASPRPRRMAAILRKPTVAQRRDVPLGGHARSQRRTGGEGSRDQRREIVGEILVRKTARGEIVTLR